MAKATKKPVCDCKYPAQTFGNGSGHHSKCPVHKQFLKEFDERMKAKQAKGSG